jgi:hypothetical protein
MTESYGQSGGLRPGFHAAARGDGGLTIREGRNCPGAKCLNWWRLRTVLNSPDTSPGLA